MDFQLQVINLGERHEQAELTLRTPDGQNHKFSVEIDEFIYLNEGRIRSVSGRFSGEEVRAALAGEY